MGASSASTCESHDCDGDQDLNFWTREIEDIVREIMEDPVFKGNQNYSFEMDLDEAGKRLFGGEANAGVAFQIGQLRYKPVYSSTSTYMYVLVHFITYHECISTDTSVQVHSSMNMEVFCLLIQYFCFQGR